MAIRGLPGGSPELQQNETTAQKNADYENW